MLREYTVGNLFKYSIYYTGQEPEFIEGDVFRIIVSLVEDYSFDVAKKKQKDLNVQKRFNQFN